MKSIFDVLFARSGVCPSWLCFTFDNPVRRLFHNPVRILSPYVQPGSTAIDIGPGKGFFTTALCSLVGEKGRVIAVDVQRRMLEGLVRRVRRQGLADRLKTHLSTSAAIGVDERADFVLAFWMVHEVPDQGHFLGQVANLLRPTATFLLSEPFVHVTGRAFSRTLETAAKAGLSVRAEPRIALSRSALLSLS